MSKPSIGWIGLGNMGIPMCKNLLKAGYMLTVYNRSENKTNELSAAGAAIAQSPAQLANNCDVVFTMVTDDDAVKEIYSGKDGLLGADNVRGKLFINTSTISPETSKEMAAQCKNAGADYLESPVSGTVKPAEEGTLMILTSGEKETFDKAKPILECLGKKVMYLGEFGSASVAKLAINLLVGFNVQGLAETILFAQKHGIDKQDMLTIINEGGVGNGTTKGKTPSILSGDYKPAFTVKNYAKDLRLAKSVGIETPMANALHKTYQDALHDYKEEDLMAIIKYLDKQ